MKTVDIFAGTQSFSKVARERGHETFTVDFNPDYPNDLTGDILDPDIQIQVWDKIRDADVVWMSPVCTSFSLAAGNTHWNQDRSPKTANGVKGKMMLDVCKGIADYCENHCKIFFIENPMARMRWFMDGYRLTHIWYCQYGDSRAKPTDIWNNLYSWNGKRCFNGNKDCHHEEAPRGSKTGTQGVKGNKARSIVPRDLFIELFDVMEGV